MPVPNNEPDKFEHMDELQAEQVALEKITYMHDFARSSTPATIIAPLLCIPLFSSVDLGQKLHIWLGLMTVAVFIRIILIRSIQLKDKASKNFNKLNWAVGVVTSVWGIGWLMLVPDMDSVNYLIYQVILLTVLFVGMVGYCVNWKTFYSFSLPLKITELLFIIIHGNNIIWPIAIGSLINFYLALKMALIFSKSWEKSISLRFKNEKLFNELIEERNISIKANIAKSEFIATASHDLRQPMQALNIFIELFKIEKLPKKERLIFTKMRSSIKVLNRMFNNLLDISRLDSKLDTSYTTFELSFILDDLIPTFQELATEKKLDLKFEYVLLKVHGDPSLLNQVLINLISNAIQYTSKGGVWVKLMNDAGKLMVIVEDTGCGIPEEDLPFIYNEFFRSQQSRPLHDGLGLGLSIVSRIVNRTGGKVSVRTAKDRGTTFCIHTNFEVKGQAEHSSAQNSTELLPSDVYSNVTVKDTVAVIHMGILENDASLMQAYLEYFSGQGYVVHPIPHSLAKFNNALETIPKLDFILSDYRLDEQEGIYFIEKLREEFNHEIPACIVTADTSPQLLTMFKELKIDVLYKPMDIVSIAKFIAARIA